jgi:tetratricopeptide (TPR) repeat protein
MRFARTSLITLTVLLASCASNPDSRTLAQLRDVEPDVAEVRIDHSLEKAMHSYRRFLEETPANAKTPEAMRRLADLQIEKAYGIIGGDGVIELPAPAQGAQPPETADAAVALVDAPRANIAGAADLAESEADFERRTTGQEQLPVIERANAALPDGSADLESAGPRQAIETYQRILTDYPYYERNDQVLYQMARAYDELGEPDKAMEVMQRLISAYGYSGYTDEVYFRRAEYFFVRKKYLDAEESYAAVVSIGEHSDFYELALYKLGWSLYKQELYEEALHQYMALLDYKMSIGYDFETFAGAVSDREPDAPDHQGEDSERRVADTFRVISLAFSNLGGPEGLNQYFSSYCSRAYEDRIYSNLGEFYLTKLRYNDAATVYESFAELNPFHKVAPHFSMRVIEIYAKGEFSQLVVEAKRNFANRYGLKADYWYHFDINEADDVLSYLKTNLKDLAGHYHSLYQDDSMEDDRPENYAQALLWYREFLTSFPQEVDSPSMNYQLADLLFEHEDFPEAAREYERTAYTYQPHEQAAAAGYAAIYAHRENLKVVSEEQETAAKRATVASSLRFADTFSDHEHAATVLGAAAEDLYEMKDFSRAIAAGSQLIERYVDADAPLLHSAWLVVAHSSFDTALYVDAEHAYGQVLDLSAQEGAEDDEVRQGLFENLAASIYKQGEQANELEDHRSAADHFLRIKSAAPTSEIRPSAEYDAATALMKLEDWAAAAEVFRAFREVHTDHELQPDVTKQLAFVYRQAGEVVESAQEYERVADDATDQALRREAMLLAGELYQEAGDGRALEVFIRYVDNFPRPLDLALEMRFKIAQIYKDAAEQMNYHETLRLIVAIDAGAGAERTPRTKYLAATSSLVLCEPIYEHFTELALTQPFAASLAEKRTRMDAAMSAFEGLVAYEVAEVTAAATFYMAEIYSHFGGALLASERPSNLDPAELVEYELAIEEEAFPFEESAIDVHEKNLELMAAGTFNGWVQRSIDQLAELMPGRYAKFEISSGFIGPVEVFAYRSPEASQELAGVEDVSPDF